MAWPARSIEDSSRVHGASCWVRLPLNFFNRAGPPRLVHRREAHYRPLPGRARRASLRRRAGCAAPRACTHLRWCCGDPGSTPPSAFALLLRAGLHRPADLVAANRRSSAGVGLVEDARSALRRHLREHRIRPRPTDPARPRRSEYCRLSLTAAPRSRPARRAGALRWGVGCPYINRAMGCPDVLRRDRPPPLALISAVVEVGTRRTERCCASRPGTRAVA